MILSRLLSRMIAYSNGNFHDINHFLKVWAYARAIGVQEQLPPEVQTTLEAAAIVHDTFHKLLAVLLRTINA